MSIRHRNLLQLLGWCHFKELMVVYDYMSNGSLDKWIYLHPDSGECGVDTLSWDMRRHILAGVASGLNYLHEVMGHCVLHRGIKPDYVLLDADFNAYLGDFRLSHLVVHNKLDSATLTITGTAGYMAPEMLAQGRVTKKTDVYAFGILVLVVMCRKRCIELTQQEDDFVLLDRVWRAHEAGDISGAAVAVLTESKTGSLQADAAVAGSSDVHSEFSCGGYWTTEERMTIANFLHLGLLCCLPDPIERPSMRLVKEWLHASKLGAMKLTPLPAIRPLNPYA